MAGIDLYSWRVVLAESFDQSSPIGRPNLLMYDPEILEPLARQLPIDEFRMSESQKRRRAEQTFVQWLYKNFYTGEKRLYHEARTSVSEAFTMDDLVHQYEVRCNGTVTRSIIHTLPDSSRNILQRLNVFTTDGTKAKLWLEDIAQHPEQYSWEKRLQLSAGPVPG